ncbi:MAG: hypothetical protein RSD47_08720 [Romboutsia sp.]
MEKILKIEEKIDLKDLDLQDKCDGNKCRYNPYIGKLDCLADCYSCQTPFGSEAY